MRVLIVEDDARMSKLLSQSLEEEGYQAQVAADGRVGLEMAQSNVFGAIVLDLMLPGLHGHEVARQLREGGNQTPILMLTARDTNEDVVRGLNLGADDYLTKPFSLEVFLARLRAVSRRGPIAVPNVLRIGDLKLDAAMHQAWRGESLLTLTPREFGLLELLMRMSPRVVSRQTILDEIWGYDSETSANNLEVFVSLLRGKVDAPPFEKLIHTVRGIGYCLRGDKRA